MSNERAKRHWERLRFLAQGTADTLRYRRENVIAGLLHNPAEVNRVCPHLFAGAGVLQELFTALVALAGSDVSALPGMVGSKAMAEARVLWRCPYNREQLLAEIEALETSARAYAENNSLPVRRAAA